MKKCIQELLDGLYDILIGSDDIKEKEKAFNILKFVNTYEISIEILRKSKYEYNEENEVKNIIRFIENYEEDIELLRKENKKIIQYVKKRNDK